MTLAEVKAAIARIGAGIDADAAFAAFRAETGSDDPDTFLRHLHEQGVFDDATFSDLHAGESIDATQTLDRPQAEASDASPRSAPSVAAAGLVPRARFRLLGTAGRGGMGTVHVAKDLDLLRKVALKQLSPEMAGSSPMLGRFVKEARITAQLDHPHIVPVYSLEVAPDGALGYSMKLVHGKTFGQLTEETREFFGARQPPDAQHSLAARLEHFVKVCDAMAYAHGKGVIHRDLKPPNLMLGRYNEVYVMDWGICAVIAKGEANAASAEEPEPVAVQTEDGDSPNGAQESTKLGTVVGTPHYMAPEQAAGRGVGLDERSDQYALGLILFEIVTLRRAIAGTGTFEVLRNAAAGRKVPLAHAFGERIPIELGAIVEKATALQPGDRYSSVGDLAADLRRYLRGEAVSARPDPIWQKAWRVLARHRAATLAGVAIIVVLSALLAVLSLYEKQRALGERRHQALRIAELTAARSSVGDRVQTHLLTVSSRLAGFAVAVEQALTHGEPSDAPYYILADFKDPTRAPNDLGSNPAYVGGVSLEQPVWAVAPGVPPPTVKATIRLLAGERLLYRRMFEDLQSSLTADSSPRTAVLPLVETMVGLENGIAMVYPGTGGLPDDFDGRQRPWYKLAAGQKGSRWGQPYRTQLSHRPSLPCSVALYDESGKFLGVASALLDLGYVTEVFLRMPSLPAVHATYLLDEQARIVARWADEGIADEERPGDVEGMTLPLFPDPAVRDAIRGGKTGTLDGEVDGRPVVVAFDAIDPFGWVFVAVADAAELFRPGD